VRTATVRQECIDTTRDGGSIVRCTESTSDTESGTAEVQRGTCTVGESTRGTACDTGEAVVVAMEVARTARRVASSPGCRRSSSTRLRRRRGDDGDGARAPPRADDASQWGRAGAEPPLALAFRKKVVRDAAMREGPAFSLRME
jgi:hypothetical protein